MTLSTHMLLFVLVAYRNASPKEEFRDDGIHTQLHNRKTGEQRGRQDTRSISRPGKGCPGWSTTHCAGPCPTSMPNRTADMATYFLYTIGRDQILLCTPVRESHALTNLTTQGHTSSSA